jgi:hypothetical protein
MGTRPGADRTRTRNLVRADRRRVSVASAFKRQQCRHGRSNQLRAERITLVQREMLGRDHDRVDRMHLHTRDGMPRRREHREGGEDRDHREQLDDLGVHSHAESGSVEE